MSEGPDELVRMGYSLADETERTAWRDLVFTVMERIKGREAEVLFHGAAANVVDAILVDGMKSTDASWGVIARNVETILCSGQEGSFYGTVQTAAAYAEDSAVERHPGERPALVAVRVDRLLEYADLVPDGATIDFPLKGLTSLDDEATLEKWLENGAELDWQEGLRDLGAVVAIHDGLLPPEMFVRIERVEDFDAMIGETSIRTLGTTTP